MNSNFNWIKLEDAILPHFKKANIDKYFITKVASDGRAISQLLTSKI